MKHVYVFTCLLLTKEQSRDLPGILLNSIILLSFWSIYVLVVYKSKVGKFQADRMLFVGMGGRKPQGGGVESTPSPIGLGLTCNLLGSKPDING